MKLSDIKNLVHLLKSRGVNDDFDLKFVANIADNAQWPTFDEKFLVESTATLGVAFNGKRRFEAQFPADADNATIEKAILADERTQKYLEGWQVNKVIIVPKRMINIVLKK